MSLKTHMDEMQNSGWKFKKVECWAFTLFEIDNRNVLGPLLDFFDRYAHEKLDDNPEQCHQLRRYLAGKEVCPTTGTIHYHVVLQWEVSHARNFFEMCDILKIVYPLEGEQKQPWGKLKRNQHPTEFIKYATKDGNIVADYNSRKRKTSTKPSRDDTASQIIEMVQDSGVTMHTIEKAFPLFTFWHHTKIEHLLSRHRAYHRGDEDGGIAQLDPNFNSI